MVLAPERTFDKMTTAGHKAEVEKYVTATNAKPTRTSAGAKRLPAFHKALRHQPFYQERIPIWVGEYTWLGTGAVLGRSHDSHPIFLLPKPLDTHSTNGYPPGETTSGHPRGTNRTMRVRAL